MVPEVLLALLGVSGEVIILVPATGTHPARFAVNPDLDLLEPPERASLDRLVQIGYAFRELERFVGREHTASALSAVGAAKDGPRRGNNGSLYRNALASGVNDVLTTYEANILRLEQDILRGALPALPAALESALSVYTELLPALWAGTVEPVAHSDMKGSSLLHHLHAQCLAAGAPALEKTLRVLFARTNRAQHQQLLAWTAHGLLVDPHHEFYVVPTRAGGGYGDVFIGNEDGDGDGLVDAWRSDDDDDDEHGSDGEMEDDDTSDYFTRGHRNSSKSGNDGGEMEWHGRFQVSLERLPPGVELPVAEAVLFAGRAVRILSKPKGGFKFSGQTSRGTNCSNSLLPSSVTQSATQLIRGFASSHESFDRREFENVVENIRKPLADRLGRLAIKDANLPKHLQGLRSYFLLGNGDFYQTFLEDAHSLFSVAPRLSTAEADLLLPFREAATKSSAANDHAHRRFRPRLFLEDENGDAFDKDNKTKNDDGNNPQRVPAYDGWDGLTLEYSVPWPLGLVLTQSTMKRYGEMFKYLLRLRRAANSLDKAWIRLRRVANARATTTPGALRAEEEREMRRRRMAHNHENASSSGRAHEACSRARRDIAFLINNWLTYLQTDVVEAQFVEMMGKLGEMTEKVSDGNVSGDDDNSDDDSDDDSRYDYDFDQAVRLHRNFLANLGAQSFLDLPGVSQSVEATLSLSRTICETIGKLPLTGFFESSTNEEKVTASVDALADLFTEVSHELYDTLRSDRLANDPKAPYLRRLLLRLNFNDFVGANASAARVRKKEELKKIASSAMHSAAPSAFGSAAPSVRSSVTSLGSIRGGWNASDPPTPKRW
jgi:gamma-tubulin complex component 4|tara:strand:+ start:1787 stop:4285 length:2499 start_codon:yes stop_codon:yes gene_type:complete